MNYPDKYFTIPDMYAHNPAEFWNMLKPYATLGPTLCPDDSLNSVITILEWNPETTVIKNSEDGATAYVRALINGEAGHQIGIIYYKDPPGGESERYSVAVDSKNPYAAIWPGRLQN
ncbi:hypothetical protein FWD07_00515 [Candidatus Saccharibacteria bacterium]|nr:hypothetical protein [Candidatus Saccharibacteria bacterium]